MISILSLVICMPIDRFLPESFCDRSTCAFYPTDAIVLYHTKQVVVALFDL